MVLNKVAADMAVDDDESDNVSEASEVTDEVTNKDIMREIKTMAKQRKHDNKKTRETARVMIAEAVDPLWGEIRSQQSNLVDLGKASIAHDDRIGRLESQFAKLDVAKSGPDLSFQKLAVKGFPSDVGLEDRLAAMHQFMSTHFPNVHAQKIEVIHQGNWQERGKNRVMTQVGLIDVGNADLREHMVKTVEARNLKVSCGGKELTVTRSMTRSADARNKALRNAADALKEQVGLPDKDVVIEWVDSKGRGVKVKGKYVFEQPRGRDIGSFTDAYAHLKLP